mgnify:FL=1
MPLKHRIYTNGFVFKEKIGERKIDVKAVKKHNVDISYLNKGVYILAGKNDGKTFSKKLLIR